MISQTPHTRRRGGSLRVIPWPNAIWGLCGRPYYVCFTAQIPHINGAACVYRLCWRFPPYATSLEDFQLLSEVQCHNCQEPSLRTYKHLYLDIFLIRKMSKPHKWPWPRWWLAPYKSKSANSYNDPKLWIYKVVCLGQMRTRKCFVVHSSATRNISHVHGQD